VGLGKFFFGILTSQIRQCDEHQGWWQISTGFR